MSNNMFTDSNDYINKDNKKVQKAFSLLIKNGYFNDGSSGLNSNDIEHKLSLIDKTFRELGYDGSQLYPHASNYENKSFFIYWTYDEEKTTYEEAKKLTDIWFKNNRDSYLSI